MNTIEVGMTEVTLLCVVCSVVGVVVVTSGVVGRGVVTVTSGVVGGGVVVVCFGLHNGKSFCRLVTTSSGNE